MAVVEFENYGHRYRLSSEEVEEAVRSLEPDVIYSLAVSVGGRWWPAKQPFVTALASKDGNIKTNRDVNSRTALRHLSRLGFATHDIVTGGPLPEPSEDDGPTVSPEDRRLALTLAVELLRGGSRSADEVTGLADKLVEWLGA